MKIDVEIDKGCFSYSRLNKHHQTQAIECLCLLFSNYEPLGKALQITPDELKPFVTDLVNYAIVNDLSWVAIDNASSQVVGVRIVSDIHHDFKLSEYGSQKLDVIETFLSSLYDSQSNELSGERNTVLHCWMVGVLPEFQQQGVLRNLYRMASSWAFHQGFRFGIEEATNKYNLHFLEKETRVIKLSRHCYAKYEHLGSYPFLTAEEHKECVLCKYALKDYLL